MQNTVHFVLQAKGGIGKSFISTLLAQHVLTETGAVRCFDTDQENTTFTHYGALKVHHVTVTNGSRLIDPKKFDGLMEVLLTEEGNFVIDTGANTFSNFLAYMVENDVFPMLEDGREDNVHPYHRWRRRHARRYSEWVSRHRAEGERHASGSVVQRALGDIKTAEGKPFTETQAYKQCAARLAGAVTLYRRNAATYGEDIRKLNTKRHTIAEALLSSEYSLMEKQRIKNFSRDVFGQLKSFAW